MIAQYMIRICLSTLDAFTVLDRDLTNLSWDGETSEYTGTLVTSDAAKAKEWLEQVMCSIHVFYWVEPSRLGDLVELFECAIEHIGVKTAMSRYTLSGAWKKTQIINRVTEPRYADHVKYAWWTTRNGSFPKLYAQRRTVPYADYRVGYWYVSPFAVRTKRKEVSSVQGVHLADIKARFPGDDEDWTKLVIGVFASVVVLILLIVFFYVVMHPVDGNDGNNKAETHEAQIYVFDQDRNLVYDVPGK